MLQFLSIEFPTNFYSQRSSYLQVQVRDLRLTISHLKDENLVLRAAQTKMLSEETESHSIVSNGNSEKDLEECRSSIADLESRLTESTSIIKEYQRKLEERSDSEFERKLKEKTEELEKLKKDQENLLELLTDLDSKIMLYKEKLTALGEKVYRNVLRTIFKE